MVILRGVFKSVKVVVVVWKMGKLTVMINVAIRQIHFDYCAFCLTNE